MVSTASWVFYVDRNEPTKQKIADRAITVRRQKMLAAVKIQESQEKAQQEREDLEVWELICRVCECVQLSVLLFAMFRYCHVLTL